MLCFGEQRPQRRMLRERVRMRTRHAGHLDLVRREDAKALHLMEDWVMRTVDRVATVDVARDEECGLARAQQLRLVRRGVTAQDRGWGDVVRVVG